MVMYLWRDTLFLHVLWGPQKVPMETFWGEEKPRVKAKKLR